MGQSLSFLYLKYNVYIFTMKLWIAVFVSIFNIEFDYYSAGITGPLKEFDILGNTHICFFAALD